MGYIETFEALTRIDADKDIKAVMLADGVSPMNMDKHLNRIAKSFLASIYESYTFGNVGITSLFIRDFSLTRMNRKMGRVRAGDRIAHLYSYFNKLEGIVVWERGYNLGYKKKLSFVGLKRDIQTQDVKVFVDAYEDIYGKDTFDTTGLEFEDVWVNREALLNFVDDDENSWEERIEAYKIYREAGEDGLLRQYISKAESPRKFYKGKINLQLCSSKIRTLAIQKTGEIVSSYDIDAGVVNYQVHMAEKIGLNLDETLPSLVFYLQNKDHVRESLAKRYDITLDQSKQIMTALSHGATLSTNRFRALYQIVRSGKTARDISKNKFLIQYKEETANFMAHFLRNPEARHYHQKFKKNKSKVMAYMYQQAEREVINKVIQQFNIEDAFTVHDCIYTAIKLDIRDLNSMIQKEWTGYASFSTS